MLIDLFAEPIYRSALPRNSSPEPRNILPGTRGEQNLPYHHTPGLTIARQEGAAGTHWTELPGSELCSVTLMVYNRAMEEVRYEFNLWICLPELSLCILQAIIGLGILFLPSSGAGGGYNLESILGSILLVLGLYGLRSASHPFLLKKPAVILTKQGIEDNSRMDSPGFVPWQSLKPGVRWHGTNLVLDFEQESPEMQEVPYIQVRKLAHKGSDLETQVRAFMTAAHTAQPPG